MIERGELYIEASKAALAIDNHLLKKATPEEYQTVKDLSEHLYNISKKHDYSYIMIIANTIWPDKKDWKGKNSDCVELQTWLLAKELSVFTELPKERQENLRSICTNLSNKSIPVSY